MAYPLYIPKQAIRDIKRVFPFDTGAFLRNFYEDIFSDQSTIEDFELPPEIDSAKRVVDAFYGDAKSYYSGMSDKRVERGNFDFEIQGVEYLAKESGLQNFNSARRVDERGSAIEIQVGASVKLGDGILALICPEEYLTEKTVQHALQRWKIPADRVHTYPAIIGPDSEAWVGIFYEKVKNIYEREKIF